MILSDILAAYRVTAHDNAVPPACADSDVYYWTNEAEEEAAIRASLIFDKTSAICTINVIAGTTIYALDPSIISISHAALTNAGTWPYQLAITDIETMDELDPLWRNITRRPTGIIMHDSTIEINGIPDANYTIQLEVFKMPVTKVSKDSPQINQVHHRHLLDWVLYRAYSKRDIDFYNPEIANSISCQF